VTQPHSRDACHLERKREAREWDERYGKLTDLSAFRREILPLIQEIPLFRLQRETGLSLRYVSLIRRGERTPHPRHWQALLRAVGPRVVGGRKPPTHAEVDVGTSCATQALLRGVL
jgi:hypothetical protein